MAPKANSAAKSFTKGTKFHAAMLKRPAGASNGSAGGRKIAANQCRNMVAALEGAEELPNKVFHDLGSSGRRSNLIIHGHRVVVYKPFIEGQQPGKKIPGIVVLHGSFATPESMFDIGFEALADKHGFLVIYPSTEPAKAADWGYESTIPFFSALPSRLSEDDIGLDTSQLFVCGHSAGGTMALFLQNEMDIFQAAGAVEAAVGHLQQWHMSRRGHRTMVIWNHADPVLEEYAPPGGEPAYYNLTINTLRRNSSKEPSSSRALPTSSSVPYAKLLIFPREDPDPELVILSWRSEPGTHSWPSLSWTHSFDAAQELTTFLLSSKRSDDVVV